jgi:hypothetical protein
MSTLFKSEYADVLQDDYGACTVALRYTPNGHQVESFLTRDKIIAVEMAEAWTARRRENSYVPKPVKVTKSRK